MEFNAAGVLFISKTHFIAGLQDRNEQLVWDGFGGARESGEDILTTAYRETFEEMLETPDDCKKAVELARQLIFPKTILDRGTYKCVVCNLTDINIFLEIAKEVGLTTPLYDIFPSTLRQFMSDRLPNEAAEIRQVTLIEKGNYDALEHPIANSFLGDIESLNQE